MSPCKGDTPTFVGILKLLESGRKSLTLDSGLWTLDPERWTLNPDAERWTEC